MRVTRFLPLLLALILLCSCRSSRKSTSSYTSSSSAVTLSCDSLLQQLKIQQLHLSDQKSHLVFVTVDPTVVASHNYDVILPDGSSLSVPSNATGYGVNTEAVRDTFSLVIDERDYKSRQHYEGAVADTTYSSAETSEYKPPASGILGSLRIVLMAIGALAACAVFLKLRSKKFL